MSEKGFTIFVLEDDEWYNKLLVHSISLNPEYLVKSFSSAEKLFQCLSEKPDVITLDYRLPDSDGEKVLGEILARSPNTEVIVISEQEDIETAVKLIKLGAYDYIVKEKNIRDRLLTTIQNIRKNSSLKNRIEDLEREVQRKYDFSGIVGNGEAMQKVQELIKKALDINITVTVTGETGTGKEVVAKAIHYNSNRKNKAFVAVNVAAIPGELIESELFGHEKGAFTGAVARRIGKFEEADGGTLFLDEIGEMELSFQAKLLRALQEKEITRIGSNGKVKTDCRIIVATHKNLKEEVAKGRFREDLYFRLFGLIIELPPLRERGKDILLLAKYFINQFCKENKLTSKSLTEEARKKLLSYHFPGNVRELKSVVELACVMSSNDVIEADNISLSSENNSVDLLANEMTLKDYEMLIIKNYLKKYDDNMKLVAQKLDVGLSTLYRLLKKENDEEAK
ncbi:MAG: sigma-54-dependent Fis family transcriptional regulator [Bacteroidia bacterium]|nr:sigma-54-dependent Fis family transcriptional regulator [Bacteroidia bacterium]